MKYLIELILVTTCMYAVSYYGCSSSKEGAIHYMGKDIGKTVKEFKSGYDEGLK